MESERKEKTMVRPIVPIIGPVLLAVAITLVFYRLLDLPWPVVLAYMLGSGATALSIELRQRHLDRHGAGTMARRQSR